MSQAQKSPTSRSRRLPRLRNGVRLLGGAAFALTLTIGTAGLATAGPVTGPAMDRTTLSESAQDDAREYWTPERMEQAAPADELVEDKDAPTQDVESSDPLSVPSIAPNAASAETDPGVAQSGTDHIGKVFFTVDGQDFVCSGNSVASDSGSTVATAGHCVNSGGAWATNWVFAPGYDQGQTPNGLWAATEIVSTSEWVTSEDISYDVAFATVVSDATAATLADTVGASGIAFNEDRGQQYAAYGYPAAAPFDGESLEDCHGAATDDTIGGTQSQGIDCDMTGGSSGGPWFLGGDAGGYQNSVNSFGYTNQPGVMYGPYFGDAAQEAYEEAAAA